MAYEGAGPFYAWTGAADGTNNKLLQFAVFAKLTPDILVEGVEVIL